MPPMVALAVAAAAVTLGARWMQREWRRVNAELARADAAARAPVRTDMPTLRQDPKTGEWRPG
ncbi:MAG TPA: hypothetical protein VHD15_05485 [Hyphomicrobiales bacterium]|nr:hypothetical protein [Hyphomicrobiales bacterium]